MSNDNCSNQTSIPIKCHYPDRGSTSDWSCREGNLLQPPELGSDTSSIWSFELVFQTSFRGETSGSVAKCVPFTEAMPHLLSLL